MVNGFLGHFREDLGRSKAGDLPAALFSRGCHSRLGFCKKHKTSFGLVYLISNPRMWALITFSLLDVGLYVFEIMFKYLTHFKV